MSFATFGADIGRVMLHVFDMPESIGSRADDVLETLLHYAWKPEEVGLLEQVVSVIGGGWPSEKVTVRLSGVRPSLEVSVCAIDAADQPKVDKFVSCVKLDWADNPERDVQSYTRLVVTDLSETPASDDDIKASLTKWAGHFKRYQGDEPNAIRGHGYCTSMVAMSAMVEEIKVQLAEDQQLQAPPSNGTRRKQ